MSRILKFKNFYLIKKINFHGDCVRHTPGKQLKKKNLKSLIRVEIGLTYVRVDFLRSDDSYVRGVCPAYPHLV